MKHKLLPLLLLLSVSTSGFSQESKKWEYSYTYRYWGARDGLAQPQVFKSFQDSYGYLWFSTNDGVSRFDGLRFENFSQADLQINSRIMYFNQYESAVYMVSVSNIVFVYPDQSMEYYPLPDNYLIRDEEIAIVGNHLYMFNCHPSTQSTLEHFGLLRFDLKNKTFSRLEENLPYFRIIISGQKIYGVSDGIIQNQQLTLYRMDDERLQAVQTIPMEKADFHVVFRKTSRNERFAVLTKGSEPNLKDHLYQCFIENDSLRWNYLTPVPGYLECIERWDEHRFLAGIESVHSAYILDTEKKSLSSFPLNTIRINDILVDKDDNLWFSTEDGVYQCSRNFFEFCQLGLGRNDNLWGVIKDSQGNVWFSSFTYGFWRADAKGNLFQVQTVYNQKDFPVLQGYMGNCEDSRGRVFQTHNYGIAVFDPRKGDSKRLDILRTGVSLAVYYDKENGKIYFGGDAGSFSYRTLNVLHANGEIAAYPCDYRHIVSICRDGNRKLRLGFFQGEARLDEENQAVVFDTLPRPYTGIVSMDLDEKGVLWKGTTQGLFAEDRQGNNRKLSDGTVQFVLHYRNQYIIWGVKDNLYLLDLPAYHRDATVNIRSFGFYDGFDVMECGQNGASIDPEGYVWLAGGDRVIRFLPEQIMQTPVLLPSAPYLAAIYNADKNSEWSLLKTSPSIQLENKSNYLRFDLLQASMTSPDKLIFRYRLNGYNEQWTASRERSLIFQNLPFGKFRLEVQSSFDEAVWSESVFSPWISIRPPFPLRLPGLLLIFLGITGLSLLLIYYTRKISIRKEEEKRQVDQLKHRAVQAKFIPHFTGNVLNSISYLASKNPYLAQKYISDFAEFSNQTLLNSDKLYRTVREELDYCQLYLDLEKLRFEEKLEYAVAVSPEVDTQKMIPTMVLQTFCENAIKHGLRLKSEGGKITIRVYPEADYVALSVEDNGIGREKAGMFKTEGTKEGLKIVQQQLDIFNKNRTKKAFLQIVDLLDEKGEACGTRFELSIP